jgi:hypothetical protein
VSISASLSKVKVKKSVLTQASLHGQPKAVVVVFGDITSIGALGFKASAYDPSGAPMFQTWGGYGVFAVKALCLDGQQAFQAMVATAGSGVDGGTGVRACAPMTLSVAVSTTPTACPDLLKTHENPCS